MWAYFGIDADPGYDAVLGRREMPGAEWFPGARLNYAQHIFRGKADGDVAVRFASERAGPESWTWGDLRARTAALRRLERSFDSRRHAPRRPAIALNRRSPADPRLGGA